MIWDHWDEGTGRAILALYRHADPDRLAAAGAGPRPARAARRWSSGASATPICRSEFAEAFADALPDAELDLVPGAGHWPWIDDVRVVPRVLDFS